MQLAKRCLPAGLGALALGLGAAPSAPAAEIVSCTFTELRFDLTPAVRPAPQQGGSARYDFGGDSVTCSYENTNTGRRIPRTAATIASTGNYENDLCGTGRAFGDTAARGAGATGNGTYVDLADPAAPDITQFDYRIDFFASAGTLRGGDLARKPTDAPGTVNGQSGWRVAGKAHIRPATGGGCVLAPVSAFHLSGTFTATRF